MKAGTLPDRISITEGMCSGCDMRLICQPEEKYKAGANIEDANFEAQLRRREELQAAKSEYDKIDRNVKSILKEAATEYAICGPFQITVKQNKSSKTINIDRVLHDENVSPTPKAPEPEQPKVTQEEVLSDAVGPWALKIQKCKSEAELMKVKYELSFLVGEFTQADRDSLAGLFSTVYNRVVK